MSRAESLIGRMTLTEKLGQLTMTACGQAVTGPTIAGDSTEAIKSGAIGNMTQISLLNHVGAQPAIVTEPDHSSPQCQTRLRT